jgi:flagellin-like protein
MKGISPMVATILLIAFTVGIGGIISVWMSGFTTSTTGNVEKAATNQTKCAGAWIRIDTVGVNSVLYSNPSSQNVTNIKLYYSDGTTVVTTTPLTTSLAPGEAASNVTARGSNTSVTIKGLCLASIPIEGKCDSSGPCWS